MSSNASEQMTEQLQDLFISLNNSFLQVAQGSSLNITDMEQLQAQLSQAHEKLLKLTNDPNHTKFQALLDRCNVIFTKLKQ